MESRVNLHSIQSLLDIPTQHKSKCTVTFSAIIAAPSLRSCTMSLISVVEVVIRLLGHAPVELSEGWGRGHPTQAASGSTLTIVLSAREIVATITRWWSTTLYYLRRDAVTSVISGTWSLTPGTLCILLIAWCEFAICVAPLFSYEGIIAPAIWTHTHIACVVISGL